MSPSTFARTAHALAIFQENPDSNFPLVLAGGTRRVVTESEVMRHLLQIAGVPVDRILMDTESVNTMTNAARVWALLGDNSNAGRLQIRLVTSALHMPRAAVEFERVGFDVCRMATDYQGLDSVPWYALLPQRTAMVKADRWLHEMVGLLALNLGVSD